MDARDPRPVGSRGRGRPAKVFALTERGRDSFDQQYDDLATEALRFLAETGGPEAVKAFAERRASFIEKRFPEVRDAHPEASPAEVLAQVFSDEGYAAAVREPARPEERTWRGADCASSTARSPTSPTSSPRLCEAETEAISRVLGTHVQRLATIAHGDGVCTTCIPDAGINKKEQVS
ncbi:transcriptional regulator [Nocardioides convexus]|uniref:helix-turn-helix transcriptional regulator n=1 Tax=Nocardioides convexus TaxID=2712224 RepID=UPI0024186E4A|nr:transcriptional regulator [Nocardioides convexus]